MSIYGNPVTPGGGSGGGGGGLTPESVTPTVQTGSFIATNKTLVIGSTDYPNYHTIAIQLSLYPGKLIQIINSDGNRNSYGLFAENQTTQPLIVFSSIQTTSGSLLFYVDDYSTLAGYLVYEFTKRADNPPTVIAYDLGL